MVLEITIRNEIFKTNTKKQKLEERLNKAKIRKL